MNLEQLLKKFNGNKKALISYLLIEKNTPLIIEFLKLNINDNSLIEFAIIKSLKEDENIFYKIDNELKLTKSKENLLLKISFQTGINFFKYSKNESKSIVNKIINNGFNIKDIIEEIKNDDSFEYLVNNFLFKDKNIGEIKDYYDNLEENRKEIINKFFLKNTKNALSKLAINSLLKTIRNKDDIEYKGNRELLQDLNGVLKDYKNPKNSEEYKNDISYQFIKLDSNYLESDIFVITDNINKDIFVSFINQEKNLTSTVFESSGVGNKRKNKFLGNIEKILNKKISEIEDGYKVICNSFVFKKGYEDLENNVFNENSDTLLLMTKIILEPNEKRDLDNALGGFLKYLKEKKEKEKEKEKQ
ncbi:MAG: hypothetical protein PHI37_03635 [Candidatus Gracilibacteria bacterium]|nr:hypothetical protein [Candidatus Gracilibacteria bacterium]